jgi:molybdenum cofactor guanylyltransferase
MPLDYEASGFVLAGGQSSRMGRDKALLPFAGRLLIAQALSILREAGVSAAIAGAQPSARASLKSFATVVDDAEPGLGPLAGICTALASTSARRAVFLAVDQPIMPPSLLVYLLHHACIAGHAITVPSIAGFAQTLPAVIDRVALPALRCALKAGDGGCFAAYQSAAASLGQPIVAVAVELLVQSGQVAHPFCLPPLRWFLNLNTPADLELAEALSCRVA